MGRPLKVLLIDDSPDDADLAILQLRRGGWELYPQRVDSRDALRAALHEHLWDVILSDFSMPGFSGEEALRLVREAGLDTPFIIISGIIGEETAVAMMRAGAQDYVMKDQLARLVPAVERELQEAGVRREKQRQEISLRKNEESLRKAQRIANFGSWEWNILTNELTWSEEVYRLYGLDPKRDLPSYDVVVRTLVPESRDRFVAAVEDAVKLGKHFEGEYRMISLDGTERCTHTVGEVICDPQGRPLSMFGVVQDITERKRAEEALWQSRNMLNQILNAMPQSVFWKDRDGVYLGCNDNFARAVGLESAGEIRGKTDFDLPWPRAEAEAYRNDDQDVIAGKRPKLHIAEPLLQADGARLWIDTSKMPLLDQQGNVYGVLGVYEDITERRKAEASLKESEARLKALIDAIPDSVIFKDAAGHHVIVNKASERLLGFKPEMMIGKTVEDLLPAEIAAGCRRNDEQVMNTGKTVQTEERSVDASGKSQILDTIKVPLYDDRGNSAGLVGLIRDITERKRNEEAVRDSQRFLQTVMDGVSEPIMVIGMDYRVLMMNNAARRNSGSGMLCHEASHHSKDPCGGDKDACPLEEVRAAGKPVSVIHEHIDDRGMVRLIEILASPYYGPDGTLLGIIESSRDITERKRAEDEKLRLERQVQHAQKLESLGVLAGGIAHDFNNILMGILGNTALALMRLPENSSGRENLLEIEKAARRAADLSMQMLAYSGKGKFLIGPIDLNKLVNEMARLLEVSISKKAELRYDFRTDLPQFEGDATQVRQIVMNLITNASEAIGEAGGSITLSTGVTVCDRSYIDSTNEVLLASYDAPLPEGRYVFLDVSDTGCGMDEDTRRKIFDPFFTTKFTGRGLGMAAVLGILRGHRGAIRIYSEVGKGTTIRVLFPAGDKIAVQQAEEEKAAEGEWRGTGTVLLVDDDKTVCAVGSELLKYIGFAVLTAPDGKKALEVFRAHAESIVAVLLDLTMPHMGGEEVFSELRRLRPDVKVVLCSGFTEQDATTRMSGKGLAGFLQKPYDIVRLSRVLKQVLGKETVLPSC